MVTVSGWDSDTMNKPRCFLEIPISWYLMPHVISANAHFFACSSGLLSLTSFSPILLLFSILCCQDGVPKSRISPSSFPWNFPQLSIHLRTCHESILNVHTLFLLSPLVSLKFPLTRKLWSLFPCSHPLLPGFPCITVSSPTFPFPAFSFSPRPFMLVTHVQMSASPAFSLILLPPQHPHTHTHIHYTSFSHTWFSIVNCLSHSVSWVKPLQRAALMLPSLILTDSSTFISSCSLFSGTCVWFF